MQNKDDSKVVDAPVIVIRVACMVAVGVIVCSAGIIVVGSILGK